MNDIQEMYRIQLKNNHWLDAYSVDGGDNFVAELSKGHKTYHRSELKAAVPTALVPTDPTSVANLTAESTKQRKAHMEYPYHFIVERTVVDEEGNDKVVHMRQITTFFVNENERQAYTSSVMAKAPVNGIYAVNTGNWRPAFLMGTGKEYRLTILTTEDLAIMGNIEKKVANTNMAWANASYAFFLNIKGEDGWGLKPLGLEVDFTSKFAKRMQEVARFTSMSLDTEDGDEFFFTNLEDMDHPDVRKAKKDRKIIVAAFYGDGLNEMLFDGLNGIDRRTAMYAVSSQPPSPSRDRLLRDIKLGDVNRLNGKLLFKRGAIKGDWAILDKLPGGANMVYHPVNLKADVRTTGRVLFTAFVHAPIHKAGWDYQSTINFSYALPLEHQVHDITLMKVNAETKMETMEIDPWMLIPQRMHNDDGTPNLDSLSEDLKRSHIRWQAMSKGKFGIPDSGNFLYMLLNGDIKAMEPGWDSRANMYKRMWIPMSNAFNAGISARSAWEAMFEMELPGDPNLPLVDGFYGMILPDQRFIDTFDLHGTHDMDDVTNYIRLRVWSSDPQATKDLRKDKVLAPGIRVPNKAERAVEVTLAIRNPNAAGEYSLEWKLGDNAPWFMVHENVTVVDLAKMPRGQSHLLNRCGLDGLTPDPTLVYGGAVTREDSVYVIESQILNNGIGAVANALMAYVDVIGPELPVCMSAPLGDLVDGVQQGCDRNIIKAINGERNRILAELVTAMEMDPSLTIDKLLATLRMPVAFSEKIPESQKQTKRHSKTSALYRKLYLYLKEQLSKTILETRTQGDFVKLMLSIKVGSRELYTWAKQFNQDYSGLLRASDKKFRIHPDDEAFTKITKQYNHKLEMEAIVAHMVKTLESYEDTNERVIALAKFIVMPTPQWPAGRYDRIIFQPGGDNNKSVMDLLLDALSQKGYI